MRCLRRNYWLRFEWSEQIRDYRRARDKFRRVGDKLNADFNHSMAQTFRDMAAVRAPEK